MLTRTNKTLIAFSKLVFYKAADKILHLDQSNSNRDDQKSEATSFRSVQDKKERHFVASETDSVLQFVDV